MKPSSLSAIVSLSSLLILLAATVYKTGVWQSPAIAQTQSSNPNQHTTIAKQVDEAAQNNQERDLADPLLNGIPVSCHASSLALLKSPLTKSENFLEIAKLYREHGQARQAIKILNLAIKFSPDLVVGWGDIPIYRAKIAVEFALLGQKNRAKKILAQAYKDLNAIDYGNDYYYSSDLAELSENYAMAGEFEEALKIANSINDPSSSSLALEAIARSYAEAGKFERALQITKVMIEPNDLANAFTAIGIQYAKRGEKEKALSAFSQALQMARTIDPSTEVMGTHNTYLITQKVFQAYLAAGYLNESAKTLTLVSELVETLETDFKAPALTEVAFNYAAMGQDEKSAKMLARSLREVKTVEYPGSKARQIFEIAIFYGQAGQIDKALELALTINDDFLKDYTLNEVIKFYAAAKQYDRAIQVAQTLGDYAERAYWLELLACREKRRLR